MVHPADPAALDRLKARIQALRAKTTVNGCTEAEAMLAAAKVAELLDRHALSLSDIELRHAACEQRAFGSRHRKRIPLDDCVGAIAAFCDCRVWREKAADGTLRHMFFGLPADVEAAHCLAEMVDSAVRAELGRYKTSAEYREFRHRDRHLANASFALGMVASIADRLIAMKAARDAAGRGQGRDLVTVKAAVVDTEFARLGLALRDVPAAGRRVSPAAYDAGGAAGETLAIAAAKAGG